MLEIGVHLILWGKGILIKKKVKPRGRPPKFEDLKNVHFKMPKAMDDRINEHSKKYNIKKSEIVRRAVDHYLNNFEKIDGEKPKVNNDLISNDELLTLMRIVHDFDNLKIIPIPDNFHLADMLRGYHECKTRSTKVIAIKTIYNFIIKKHYLDEFIAVEEFLPIWRKMAKIAGGEHIVINLEDKK